MDLRPVRTEAEYDAALKKIQRYFENEPEPGTAEGDRFDLLTLIIADYESKQWGIEPPKAPDAIRELIEWGGYKQADLAAVLGSKSRACEVRSRRRHLTSTKRGACTKNRAFPPRVSSALMRFDSGTEARRLSTSGVD